MTSYDASDEMAARDWLGEDGDVSRALVHAVLALCARVDDLGSLIAEEIARATR